MGDAAQLPWDRIITAAAASTLGVVSLIILAAAAVAVLLFRGSGDRTKMIVFALLVIGGGGIIAAVLRESNDPAAPPKGEVAVQSAQEELAQDEAPAAATTAEEAQRPGPVASATPRNLSGDWLDNEGYTYRVSANGPRFAYTQMMQGVPVGSGEGLIDGRNLRYQWVSSMDMSQGECVATIMPDGDTISGTCSDGSSQWPFRVDRIG